jgi:hypothetical protein
MSTDLSIATLIENEYLAKNIPPSKVIMGFPLYGRKFLVSKPYLSTNSSETVNYRDLPFSSCTRNFDTESKVPWLSCGSYYISYDDEESLQAKIDYAQSKNLGGVFMWALGADAGKIVEKIPTGTLVVLDTPSKATIVTKDYTKQSSPISAPEEKIHTLMEKLSRKYADKNIFLTKMGDVLKKLESIQSDGKKLANKAMVNTYINIIRSKVADLK